MSGEVKLWPCGCPVGGTPHGAGWKDCIFSDEQKSRWIKIEEFYKLPPLERIIADARNMMKILHYSRRTAVSHAVDREIVRSWAR